MTALREDLGNTIDVQRLRDDVARLADDVDLLARAAGVGCGERVGQPGEIVFIPDDDYDPALWSDAEDEGVGPRTVGLRMPARHLHGVSAPRAGRASPRGTLREDRWWLQPLVTFVGLHRVAALRARSGPPRSATTGSPTTTTSRRSRPPACPRPARRARATSARRSATARRWCPYAILTLPFLLLFRLTCYYYRKAYYRSFWLSPPACAVAEPHASYTGETRFPLILQNAHRYFFYAAVLISLINTYDALVRLPRQGRRLRLRPGHVILLANVVLLWCYTLSAATPAATSSAAGSTTSPSTRSATGCGARCAGSTPAT